MSTFVRCRVHQSVRRNGRHTSTAFFQISRVGSLAFITVWIQNTCRLISTSTSFVSTEGELLWPPSRLFWESLPVKSRFCAAICSNLNQLQRHNSVFHQ